MSKLFRALLISAVATGAAAVVLKLFEPEPSFRPSTKQHADGPYVDADRMTDEERDLLIDELASQL